MLADDGQSSFTGDATFGRGCGRPRPPRRPHPTSGNAFGEHSASVKGPSKRSGSSKRESGPPRRDTVGSKGGASPKWHDGRSETLVNQ